MNPTQFNLSKLPNGDVYIQGGIFIDLTRTTTAAYVLAYSLDGIVTGESDSFAPSPVLAGGSGRNILMRFSGNPNLPYGVFRPISDYVWVNDSMPGGFYIEFNQSTGTLDFKNATDTIATAPLGAIAINNRAPAGATVSYSGPGTQTITIDLGTATGTTNFSYSSLTGSTQFDVIWNGVSQFSVTGTGTTSFNKTTSSPITATVQVTAIGDGATSSFNLGVPGGGSPPYTPPALGTGRIGFVASSTTYGASLNGGVSFNLFPLFENSTNLKTCSVIAETSIGSDFTFTSDNYQRFYDATNQEYEILIKSTGAEFRDSTDIIAIKDMSLSDDLTDPTGFYYATDYGKSKYEFPDGFSIGVQHDYNNPIGAVFYYIMRYSAGVFVGAEGPYSLSALPANTATEKILPLGEYNASSNTLLQLWEGPVLLNKPTDTTKSTTGDFASGIEGQICVNTFDNNVKIYAEGAWRQIASW
jgi:hypothetical protein